VKEDFVSAVLMGWPGSDGGGREPSSIAGVNLDVPHTLRVGPMTDRELQQMKQRLGWLRQLLFQTTDPAATAAINDVITELNDRIEAMDAQKGPHSRSSAG
jgi:hypothetical protein